MKKQGHQRVQSRQSSASRPQNLESLQDKKQSSGSLSQSMKNDLDSLNQVNSQKVGTPNRISPRNFSQNSGEETQRKVFDVKGRPINRGSFSYNNSLKVDLTKAFSYNMTQVPAGYKIPGSRPVSGKSRKVPKNTPSQKSGQSRHKVKNSVGSLIAQDNRAVVKTILDQYNLKQVKNSSTRDLRSRSKSPQMGPHKPQKSRLSIGAPSEEFSQKKSEEDSQTVKSKSRIHQPPKSQKQRKMGSFANNSQQKKSKNFGETLQSFDQFIIEQAKLQSSGTTQLQLRVQPDTEFMSPQIIDSARSIQELETVRRNSSNNTRPKYQVKSYFQNNVLMQQVPESTKNSNQRSNRFGLMTVQSPAAAEGEGQQADGSIQKLLGGVFGIFKSKNEDSSAVRDAYFRSSDIDPVVANFAQDIEQVQNDTLRKTPEINFALKSRPKHAGFISQSSKKQKSRKFSAIEDQIKMGDFQTAGYEMENELENVPITNEYNNKGQNYNHININHSEEKNLIRQQQADEGCDLEDGVDAPEYLNMQGSIDFNLLHMKTPLKKFFGGTDYVPTKPQNNINLKMLLQSKRQNSQQNLFKTRGISVGQREQTHEENQESGYFLSGQKPQLELQRLGNVPSVTKYALKSKSPRIAAFGNLGRSNTTNLSEFGLNNKKRDISKNTRTDMFIGHAQTNNRLNQLNEEPPALRVHKSVNFEKGTNFQVAKPDQEEQPGFLSYLRGFFGSSDVDHATKMGQRGRQSADTKASSSQSALIAKQSPGYSPQEALEILGPELTEFEKIELGIFEKIYTIGKVRRQNQYQIADKEGYYITQVGEQLGYRYEIVRIIDQGAFGQVVKCIDHGDPKQPIVAAKIGKNKKFDVDNANVEIRLLKKLQEGIGEGKERIVEILDSFKFRQHVVIIFEHLHYNLYRYMKCNKNLNQIFEFEHLRQICLQMVQGLKYLKDQKIIHCDMKPENVIFKDDSYQEIKLIDFGASCQDCTTGFFYVQSRYYRAPEIVLGIQYDHAVDMWSLGCIVYELITGKPLFPAHDENELLEFMILTVSKIPQTMLDQAKKYKQFYIRKNDFFSFYQHELIRSKESTNGEKIIESSQPVSKFLEGRAPPVIINFVEQCLILDPALRLTPHDAINHVWFK